MKRDYILLIWRFQKTKSMFKKLFFSRFKLIFFFITFSISFRIETFGQDYFNLTLEINNRPNPVQLYQIDKENFILTSLAFVNDISGTLFIKFSSSTQNYTYKHI